MDAVGDGLAVRPADAHFQAIEDLQYLEQESLLGGIADGEQEPGYRSLFAYDLADVQEKAA